MLLRFRKTLLLAVAFLFIMQGAALAIDVDKLLSTPADDGKKPRVALLYVNNAKTTYDEDLNKKMLDNFKSLLGDNRIIVSGEPYLERLNKAGMSDITTAEREDITGAFKGDDVDYVLYAELQPFVRKQRITFFTIGIDMTAIVPVKIIDLKNNKYLYNGKFTEFASDSTMIGNVGNKSVSMKALDKTIEKMNAVVSVRLPAERPVVVQKQ
ncbi:MAG TPA: hypothetical protein VN521_06210 [Negativicutes bacterium]|nr:hypothetical protein [Negativicutes bacterium]